MNKKQAALFFSEISNHLEITGHRLEILKAVFYQCANVKFEQKTSRRIKAKVLCELPEWEEKMGCQLNSSMISSWCLEKGLYHPTITRLIEEFRIEMISKGKEYADFKSAFQTYLTKGYLSLTLAGAQATSKREAMAIDSTNVNRRGGDL